MKNKNRKTPLDALAAQNRALTEEITAREGKYMSQTFDGRTPEAFAASIRRQRRADGIFRWGLITVLLTVIFTRLFFFGFYSKDGQYHVPVLTLITVIAFAGLLVAAILLRRDWGRTLFSAVRVFLYCAGITMMISELVFASTVFCILLLPLTVLICLCFLVGSLRARAYMPTGGNSRLIFRRFYAFALCLVLVASLIQPMAAGDFCVQGGVLNRTVCYEVEEDEAYVHRCRLTVFDMLGIQLGGAHEVLAVVPVGNFDYSVTAIGEDAFSGVRSVQSVTVPESVTRIERGAFSGSSVSVLMIDSEQIYLEDGLSSSGIEQLWLTGESVCKITLGASALLPEGLRLMVPESLIDEYRLLYGELQERFVPFAE